VPLCSKKHTLPRADLVSMTVLIGLVAVRPQTDPDRYRSREEDSSVLQPKMSSASHGGAEKQYANAASVRGELLARTDGRPTTFKWPLTDGVSNGCKGMS
jgi:hypothetical protein